MSERNRDIEKRKAFLNRAKAVGISTAVLGGVSGLAGIAGERGMKNPVMRNLHTIDPSTIKSLKAGALLIPAGLALTGYVSYKKKKEGKGDK